MEYLNTVIIIPTTILTTTSHPAVVSMATVDLDLTAWDRSVLADDITVEVAGIMVVVAGTGEVNSRIDMSM